MVGQQTVMVKTPRPTITCLVSTYSLFFSDRRHNATMQSTLIKHSPPVELPPAHPPTVRDDQEGLRCWLLWRWLDWDTQTKVKSEQ